jgi:hypothetical protein
MQGYGEKFLSLFIDPLHINAGCMHKTASPFGKPL